MSISLHLVLATLLGCGGEPADVSKSPEGRLCQRAYSSTVDSLTNMFNEAGQPLPDWPDKATYIEKCAGMGFTEEQLKCLDPKWAQGDPAGCKTTMEPVEAKKKELSKWFTDQIKKEGAKPAEEATENKEEGTE